mgnify:FL=1
MFSFVMQTSPCHKATDTKIGGWFWFGEMVQNFFAETKQSLIINVVYFNRMERMLQMEMNKAMIAQIAMEVAMKRVNSLPHPLPQ